MYGLTFTFFLLILLQLGDAQRGNPCTSQATKSSGTCKLFSECASARQDLQQHNRFPQTCGFEGTQPIVCCVEGNNNDVGPRRQPGEISKMKCREYSRHAIQRRKSPTLKIGASDISSQECGHTVVKLIVGGENAGRKEFPHMASIGYEPSPGDIKWFCGGTILSDQYVLTAAHCLSDYEQGDAKWVRLGVTNLNHIPHKQDIKVIERIPFPQYKTSSNYHDIGLLKLEKPATMNPYARPACLYPQRDVKAEKAIATGWGHTSFGGEGSVKLRKVTLDLFHNAFCNSSYKNWISRKLDRGIVDELQLCAGSEDPDKDKDTCQGDSGGPLQIYHIGDDVKCMYDIVGVTSFGKGCSGSPGVYVRVSNYIKWIEDTVWPITN